MCLVCLYNVNVLKKVRESLKTGEFFKSLKGGAIFVQISAISGCQPHPIAFFLVKLDCFLIKRVIAAFSYQVTLVVV